MTTPQDNELALRIAKECGATQGMSATKYENLNLLGSDRIAAFAAHLKAAWLEQYFAEYDEESTPDRRSAYLAGCASRNKRNEELTLEIGKLQKVISVFEDQKKVAASREPEIQALREEVERSYIEASNLATSIWRQFYQKTAPDWGVCDSTQGVISQLDNMFAGVRERLLAAQLSERKLREALEKCGDQLTRLGYSANHADEALSTPTNTDEADKLIKALEVAKGALDQTVFALVECGAYGRFPETIGDAKEAITTINELDLTK